jgi:hypothetical protein
MTEQRDPDGRLFELLDPRPRIGRHNNLTADWVDRSERYLYQLIHSARLVVGDGASVASTLLLWHRRWMAGLVAALRAALQEAPACRNPDWRI